MTSTALFVVDMQNGFMTPECRHIIPNVLSLIDTARKRNLPLIVTKFVNTPDSAYVKWIGWNALMDPPETDLIPELSEFEQSVYTKTQYSAFTPDILEFIKQHNITRIILCGLNTDGCILKTAVDAFERGIESIIVADACFSHGGQAVHEAGLMLIRRFVGEGQVIGASEVDC